MNKFYPSNSLVEPVLSSGGGYNPLVTRVLDAFSQWRIKNGKWKIINAQERLVALNKNFSTLSCGEMSGVNIFNHLITWSLNSWSLYEGGVLC